jgi:hypothetical protein
MAQVLAVPGDRRHGFDHKGESSNTVFAKMHNLSGSTCNMHCSVGMVTNAMFSLDMATSQGLPVSVRQLKYLYFCYVIPVY